MTVDLTIVEGPDTGLVLTDVEAPTQSMGWGMIPITKKDTDGKSYLFIYQKSPISDTLVLIDKVLVDQNNNSYWPSAAGMQPPVVQPDIGWTAKYGTNETCISATASCDITILTGPPPSVTFDLTTTATANTTPVVHILAASRKAANCPTDPTLVANVIKTTLWTVNANAAQAVHTLKGLQGIGYTFYSQWIVPTGPDAGWTNATLAQIW